MDRDENAQINEALRFVAQKGWALGSEDFPNALARHLGEALGVDYVVIGKLCEEPETVETVALYAKGKMLPNMRYALPGTPCENVVQRNLCCYPTGVRKLFPKDHWLVGMEVDSYAGVPLWDSQGHVVGVIAVMDGKPLGVRADIAQKLLQIVAARAAADLERERAEAEARRRDAERARLERQIQEAAKLETLGRFAGAIVHDFNNILGAITEFGRFIVEDLPSDHRCGHYAKRIIAATESGKDLVGRILTFARQQPSLRSRFLLSDVVTECLPMLQVAVSPTIRVGYDPGPVALKLEADRGQIGQVVMNLCLNARDAMQGAGGTISIRTGIRPASDPLLKRAASTPPQGAAGVIVVEEDGAACAMIGRCEPDRPYATLSVRDTGAGMDTELLAKIFDPFFTTKAVGRGTGLGLSVVHGIVLSHGGIIAVRSTPRRGTVFEVMLPLADAGASLPKADPPAASARLRAGAGWRVLLVGVDGDAEEVLSTMLERRGWTVTRHTDSRAALAAFLADPAAFDLVLTDQVMPELSGDDLIARIRQSRTDLPCVLCAGFAGATMSRDHMNELGIAALLTKPVDPPALDEALGRAFPEKERRPA